MIRNWGISILLCLTEMSSAQQSEYEHIKQALNANSLPLVNIIIADVDSINKDNYTDGEIEISDFQRRTDGTTETACYHCQYKYRGMSSLQYDKKSFSVRLTDNDGEFLDASIFGMREDKGWILDAMAIDRIRMRNRVCFDCWNAISRTPYSTIYDNRNGTEGVFVEVFINGCYHGLYCMTDKISRKLLGMKKERVNGDGLQTVRGVLYKGTSWGSGSNLLSYTDADMSGTVWNAWELQYPDANPSAATWQPLMDLIDFCSYQTQEEQFVEEYQDWFYTDNLVDYFVFTSALNVGDNLYKNTYISSVDLTQSHRYLITPWDMDMSLGGLYNGLYHDVMSKVDRYDSIAPYCRLRLNDIDGFNEKLRVRWEELSQGTLSIGKVEERLDKYADMFIRSGAWGREYSRWNNNPVPLKEDLAEELAYVKDWYRRNYNVQSYLFNNLAAVPSLRRDAEENAIYTLDGRRVSTTAAALRPGIYIIGGKKKVVQKDR